jgi:hypothetical protein
VVKFYLYFIGGINAYSIVVGKPVGKLLFRIPTRREEYSINVVKVHSTPYA